MATVKDSLDTGGGSAGSNMDETAIPLLKSDRDWGSWELFMVLTVTAAATWCYIIGEYVGYYLNLKMGFASLAAGSMIGVVLVALALLPTTTRYGIDSIRAAVPQFGNRGWTITVFLQFAVIIGWNSILVIFFGMSVHQLAVTLGVIGPESGQWLIPVATIVSCAIIFLVVREGSRGIEKISKYLFMIILGLSAWIIYQLLVHQGDTLATAEPMYAEPSRLWNYTIGIEIGIVTALSWWPYVGAMVRKGRSHQSAVVPTICGLGPPVAILSVVGLAAILALQTSDPSAWLVELGGPTYGAIALFFVIIANLGTAIVGVYASSLGIKQLPGVVKLQWYQIVLLSLAPVAIVGVFMPELFFFNFGSFLAFIGVFFAPLAAIQITDYFFLRGRQLSLKAIYDKNPDSAYAYWGGFNIAALVAMVAGFFTYTYLLHPLTYVSRFPYEYVTASLPAAVIAGLVYLVVTKVLVQPAGKGGYTA